MRDVLSIFFNSASLSPTGSSIRRPIKLISKQSRYSYTKKSVLVSGLINPKTLKRLAAEERNNRVWSVKRCTFSEREAIKEPLQ